MARQARKTAGHSSDRKPTSKDPMEFSLEKLGQELKEAIESGDHSKIVPMLDSAPKWMRNQPEFLLFRASALMSIGEEYDALQILQDIVRKFPHLTEAYTPLAILYMNLEMPAHALQAAKRAISDRSLQEEGHEAIESILQEATAILQDYATECDVSMVIMHQAAIWHERAIQALDENNLMQVDEFTKKAIQLAPAWNPPYNNRAQAYYFNGKPCEAIEILESLLIRDERDVFALSSLVTFHYGLDQMEQARSYADRLLALVPQFPSDGYEIDSVITALALLEDTRGLWKFAKKFLDQPADALTTRSWICLAIAAVRMNKWKNGEDLMEKAQEEEELSPLAQNFLSQIRIARRHQPPRLDWMPPGYPGPDLFLNPKILIDLASLLRDSSKTQSPGHRKKIERFLNQYPFLPLILNRLLLGENSSSFAVDILVAINQPNSDAVLINFALSQVGSKSARMKAILDLLQTGRYSGPKVIRIWDETMGEWREVILSTQRIGEIPIKVQPKTMSLIEKAHRSKNPQDAVSLLRKAVEFEPTCAQAIFNLGVMLTQIGEQEEGENLIYQSVVVDPTYTFGHASIALTEMEDENEQAALEHLQFVNQAEVITPETAVIANLAQSMIALRKRDLKGARNYLNIAAELNPDHRLLKEFQARIERAEAFGFILEYQRKSAARGHRKLLDAPITGETGLHACLETNTKDMLVGSAQFLHTSSAGKKGELASRLAKNLLDAEFLREILEEDLNEKECEALKWILNGGGIQPWEDFARKYSYDQSESLFWIYHEPESVAGRLRRSGLLFSGKLEGQRVIFIPADVRELLRELLN